MEDNQRDLANQLMAALTAMLEETHLLACAGQSATATSKELTDYGEQLKNLADDIKAVAQTVVIVSRCAIDRPTEKP